MLVLSRKKGEAIDLGRGQRLAIVDEEGRVVELLDGQIEFKVVEIRGGKVRLGITADERLNIVRDELPPEEHGGQEAVDAAVPAA